MPPKTKPRSKCIIRRALNDQSKRLLDSDSLGHVGFDSLGFVGTRNKHIRPELGEQSSQLHEFDSLGHAGTRNKRIRPGLDGQSSKPSGFGSLVPEGSQKQPGSNKNTLGSNRQDVTREKLNESGQTTRQATVIDTTIQDDSSDLATENVGSKKKRVRGPTCMPKVWGQPLEELVAVSFNDLGQPNDEHKTSTLSHFLGTIARNGRYCPLHYKDWRLVPQTYKEEMIQTVKTKFRLPAGQEPFIWKSINKKWRNWKNYLKSLNFDPNIPIEEQMINIPTRVDEDQYKMLVEHWKSAKFKTTSAKNQQTRAQLGLVHRTGKKSFARVKEMMKNKLGRYPTRAELFKECYYKKGGSPASVMLQDAIEQMNELAEEEAAQFLDNGHCAPTADDLFAKVMGNDKHGYVRMYGLGVKPADIYGAIPSREAGYRMAMEYKEKYLKEKDKYDALNQKLGKTNFTGQSNDQSIPFVSPRNHRSSSSTSRPSEIRARSRVVLKSLENINEVVASGYISAMNSIRVTGEELGPGWCEVNIQCVIQKNVRLFKPYDHIQTIGDSIGAPVAWPLSLVALDDNDDF